MRRASRRAGASAATAPAETSATTFVVAQVRQALQHAVAAGVCSAALLAIGTRRMSARSKMLPAYSRPGRASPRFRDRIGRSRRTSRHSSRSASWAASAGDS